MAAGPAARVRRCAPARSRAPLSPDRRHGPELRLPVQSNIQLRRPT
jgi:hypothetical protein